MKFKAFSSLLLGCLMVMTAQGLGDSLSRVVQGDQEENKNKLEVTRITSMYAPKHKELHPCMLKRCHGQEPFERTGAAHMRKLGSGGKKLTKHEETSMDSTSKSDKGAHGGGSSKISGKKKDALEKSLGCLRDQRNDIQEHMRMRPKEWKFASFAIRRSGLTNTNTKCSKDCNAVPVKVSLKSPSKSEEPQGTAQKDETPSMAEAAKEIASLMYKDYKGKPSHKPPINNHEPRN